MNMKLIIGAAAIALAAIATLSIQRAAAQGAVDNSALSSKEFREHKRTFGLVYTLPKEVNAVCTMKSTGVQLPSRSLTLSM